MKLTKFITTATLAVAGLALATSASAFTLTEQAQFTESETATMVKYLARPYVITVDEGSLNVYRGNKRGTNWTQVDPTASSVSALPTNVVSTNTVRVYDKYLYLAINTEDGAEVWKISLRKRIAAWEQVGTDGLSVDGTEVTAMFNQYAGSLKNSKEGGLYAFTKTEGDLTQLVSTTDGTTWSAVGDAGLGDEVSEIVAGARVRADGEQYAYVATNDGVIYSSPIADLETWTLQYNMSAYVDGITSMRTYRGKLYITTVNEDGVDVWYTTDGETYTQLDEEGVFDGATDARMTKYGKASRYPLLVSVQNYDDGGSVARIKAPGSATPTLSMELENGDDSWYTHIVRKVGRVMLGNNEDGVKVYTVKK